MKLELPSGVEVEIKVWWIPLQKCNDYYKRTVNVKALRFFSCHF
jgi:hypothetical protein